MTKRTKTALAIIGIVLLLGVFGYSKFGKGNPSENRTDTATTTSNSAATSSPDGLVTKYFGDRVDADFNGDGKKDAAFIITQTSSGSGTFYYLAYTLGGEAIFLGDRIAPQSVEWKNGEIVVNYADRKPGEPMTTKPSVGVSRYFKAVGENLVEVKQ